MSNSQAHTKPYLIERSKKSIFGSGYSEAKKKKLESVTIPGQTRCRGCKKLKKTPQFSNKQLSDLRNYIAMGNTMTTWGMLIECRQCTGVQIHEMTCAVCEETKGLDGFSKAQRRNPDNARCLECVDNHLAADPTIADEHDMSGDEEEYEEGSASESLTNVNSQNDVDSEIGGGAILNEEALDDQNEGYNRKENARSTNASNNNSFFKTAAKSSNYVMGKSSGGGKFAKIPAERPVPPQSLRSSAVASSKGRQVKYESGGSDDDWGTLPGGAATGL